MTGHIGKQTNGPIDVMATVARAEVESQWGEITGEIVSFDPDRQTATVQPDYRPTFNGKPVVMPELPDVPVRFPRAGGFVITVPVRAGDKVVLRPMYQSTESFHAGGDFEAPGDARVNSLSDMEAHLDGGESLSKPIPKFNADNMEIRSEDGAFGIEITEDGKFRMGGALGDIIDLLARLAEIVAEKKTIVGSGSSAGQWPHTLQDEAGRLAAKIRGMQI